MIAFLNLVIVASCIAIAGLELNAGHYPSAFAYGGFALGYVGLAWLYATI